jgi:3-phosphoshikimate 1-carboxyvinyltransferase
METSEDDPVLVEPAQGLQGDVGVPGDKSLSHRALMLGALAEGSSEIRQFGASADTLSTASVLRQLGASIEIDGDTARVTGVGLRGLTAPEEALDCGNAGTLMRLSAGFIAGQEGTFELIGDASLSRRPLERVAEPLRRMGAQIETIDGRPPLTIVGTRLQPISYELPVASAQVKSAVLLAGLLAERGPTEVREPRPTRDHTERMLAAAGARVAFGPGRAAVWPATALKPLSFEVPGDFSSAAPLLAAGILMSSSRVRVHGVGVNPTRTGFLSVLERMGARVSVFNRRTAAGEPVADIEVSSSELVATSIGPSEVPLLIDELPLFALVAGLSRGESVVWGAEELRVKESDRIASVTRALRAIGMHIEERSDGFAVRGVPSRPQGGRVSSDGDHRIAMIGALAGLLSRDGVSVEGAGWVTVSYPGFFDVLDSLRS